MVSRSVNIALFGRSGSGKTFVAKRLCRHYNYQLISSGKLCRDICNILFGDESKGNLNKISTSIREIDKNIWIKAALRSASNDRPIVFDSIRYISDYQFFKAAGFILVRVVGSPSLDAQRLKKRGQKIREEDRTHPSEWEAESCKYNFEIINDGVDASTIDGQIAVLLRS